MDKGGRKLNPISAIKVEIVDAKAGRLPVKMLVKPSSSPEEKSCWRSCACRSMPLKMWLVLCEFRVWVVERNAVRTGRERGACRERNGSFRGKGVGKEREDVG